MTTESYEQLEASVVTTESYEQSEAGHIDDMLSTYIDALRILYQTQLRVDHGNQHAMF